jgi:hypothetical protein
MKLRHAAALAGCLALSGCWARYAGKVANNIDSNPPYQRCLSDAGIDPTALSDCVRHSGDQQALIACYPLGTLKYATACTRKLTNCRHFMNNVACDSD